jgi:hypothetical protein
MLKTTFSIDAPTSYWLLLVFESTIFRREVYIIILDWAENSYLELFCQSTNTRIVITLTHEFRGTRTPSQSKV